MYNFKFTLNFDDGSFLNASPNSALIFLDETGDEQLKDPNYPIFGFGGCCILAKHYFDIIHIPWTNMKYEKFKIIETPLHSSGNIFNKEQIMALNNFFISNVFGRFAVLTSTSTKIDPMRALEQIVYLDFHNRIIDIIKWHEFENIIIIYEESKRLKPKLEKYSVDISENVNGFNNKIDIHPCVMNKRKSFPGLEVADFIIHSAGTSLRDLIRGKINKLIDREDFKNIFANIDKKYSSFINIDSATFTSKK